MHIRAATGAGHVRPALASPWRACLNAAMRFQEPPRVDAAASPCQSCGACCAYSRDWPRFTTEDDAALDRIPARFVNTAQSGMRCEGERCAALSGRIGERTACTVYALRPEVCRACQPGDPECAIARRSFGLPELASIFTIGAE
jgi:Fe-S-cluster containining protein